MKKRLLALIMILALTAGTAGCNVLDKFRVVNHSGEIVTQEPGDNNVTVIPADPTKPFYTFNGWSPAVPTTMPAENRTCTAQWTAKDTYYVVGSMNNWTVSEAYELTASTSSSGEYSGSVALAAGDEIKVVHAVGGVKDDANHYPSTEHPGYNGATGNYTVDANHAGNVTLYFRPAGNFSDTGWQVFGGYFYIEGEHYIAVTVASGDGTARAVRQDTPGTAAASAPKGMSISIEYTPADLYEFEKIELWNTNTGVLMETQTTNTFSMPDYDVTFKVYFKLITWTFVDITWTETDTGYTAAANYIGSDDSTRSVEAGVTSAITVQPGCTTTGTKVYTAAVTETGSLDGLPHEGTKAETLAATGHDLEATPASTATCTEAGNTAYWTCKTCGKYFSDAEGTNEIEVNSWIIPANGHTYGEQISEVDATCEDPGTKAHYKCSACEKLFDENKNETTAEAL
ncbi:MAG: hypothetical protein IK001_07765, partial [Lachnospiraceae bacterium]|nr:hypothetical protein [Lachnospiraceae bacterium]